LGSIPYCFLCFILNSFKNFLKKPEIDFMKKTNLENLTLKSSYSSKDIENLTVEAAGVPPYRRGIYDSMYTERPWTIRQYAGFSTAEDSNAFYKECLRGGQRGLSVAFDLATHRGYDSDHPRVQGDVGKAGVAIDSVEDMKILFEGIPLKDISVSMTMNGAVLPILACYIVAAEEQGVDEKYLSGTIQNDILKEFLVRNTYIYPPAPSMRIVGDIFKYTSKHMPKFNPISISGYHMQEAGATAVQELAYTLANGIEYVELGQSHGLGIDDFAPRLSFFFAIGMNFFVEIAKLRAARVLWARLMEERGAKNPKSLMLRVHCQTSGVSLTAQDPYNNIIRTTLEALAAVLGGTQSLHTNSFDEALALPTPFSAKLARNTQLILQHEAGLCDVVDPLGGSYYIESLTENLICEAQKLMDEVQKSGGMIKAIEKGIPQRHIEKSAALRQIRFEQKEDVVVGVNDYISKGETPPQLLDVDSEKVRVSQLQKLEHLKATRNSAQVTKTLQALSEGSKGQENLLELTLDAVRARATVGEISESLAQVFTRYQSHQSLSTGFFMQETSDKQGFHLRERTKKFFNHEGRQPRILIAKLGQDGHDRGAKMIASALADYGFDVDLGPLFQTPEEVIKQAIENDVHFIGVSTQAGGHKILIPRLLELLHQAKADDIEVVVGGIIPEQDRLVLTQKGVKLIFGPGTATFDIADQLLCLLEKRHSEK
jgi:methylmalonyl-CoA mutase